MTIVQIVLHVIYVQHHFITYRILVSVPALLKDTIQIQLLEHVILVKILIAWIVQVLLLLVYNAH